MATKYTREELKNMSSEAKDLLIISMQDQLETLNEAILKNSVLLTDSFLYLMKLRQPTMKVSRNLILMM